jgi:DNA-binding transcriptional MerR regulator
VAGEHAPTGWYIPDEVGRLAGVSARDIGQWARRGYIQAVQSYAHSRTYTYGDVAEAMIDHWLIRDGVPRAEILRTGSRCRR